MPELSDDLRLVSEAGGRFRDPSGGTRWGPGGLYTNGRLDDSPGDVLCGHRFDGPPVSAWH